MELELSALSQSDRYKLLTALVIPRPIAWITSVGANGEVNAAPYSFFNVLGNRPPIIAFGPGDKPSGDWKDTAKNVVERGDFVVNLVDPSCAKKMHDTAAPFPADMSEVEALGLSLEPSVSVSAPRLADSQVHLECRYWGTVDIEDNRVVFGIVKHIHVRDGIVDPTTLRLVAGAFTAVGRLEGPGAYCTTDSRFELGRFPTVEGALANKG